MQIVDSDICHAVACRIAGVAMSVIAIPMAFLSVETALAQASAEDEIVKMLAQPAPYHVVSPELSERSAAQSVWLLPSSGCQLPFDLIEYAVTVEHLRNR